MLLLVGDSTAGKTRSAYEALSAVLPEAELVVPTSPEELGPLVEVLLQRANEGRSRVLWLDDLEHYLVLKSSGFNLVMLRDLRRAGVIVLATIRQSFREAHEKLGSGSDVFRSCREIAIKRLWTDSELGRLREAVEEAPDSRMTDALKLAGNHGIAESLVAGPRLLEELDAASRVGGNPRGAAIVRAAVGLTLAGVEEPLSEDTLRELHESCLEGERPGLLAPEDWSAAYSWATQVRYGVTALLLPADSGLRPFDYLVDATLRERGPKPDMLPESVWRTAVRLAETDNQRFGVAFAAYMNDLPAIVMEVLQPLAEQDDFTALRALGEMLRGTDPKTAKKMLRRAIDLGDGVAMRLMGNHFMRNHQYEKGRKWFIRAAKAGDAEAHAYFRRPGVWPQPEMYDEPAGADECLVDDQEDEDYSWGLTARTRAVLRAALEMMQDAVGEDLEEIGGRPIRGKNDDLFVLSDLPAQAWKMKRKWRRNFQRCFEYLADDLRTGDRPTPTCTGEEMALHLALQSASAMTADEPDLVAAIAGDLPAERGDYDWSLCSDLLFEDHDVLFLYLPWMSSVADPDSFMYRRLGIAYLQPEEWFIPFYGGDSHLPKRAYKD